jgi:hypothetical protein
MSYGGWVGALVAAMEPDLRCALLLEPIVNFEFAVWTSPATLALRSHIARNGVTRELSAEMDRWISPLAYEPKCNRDRIALIAAAYDRVITPDVIRHFAETWQCPRFRCYPQGHVGYRLMREAFREWSEELST